MRTRGSGILLHISSLPSDFGIGDLGPQAYRFADFLNQAKQSFWQVLPLTPTHPVAGNSPYYARSAFAGNPLLISPELLVGEGLLDPSEISPFPPSSGNLVDFLPVIEYKNRIFDLAFQRFRLREPTEDYRNFCLCHADWLEDYCRFVACHDRYGERVWSDWPPEIRDREPGAIKRLDGELQLQREREKFLQYAFHRQWSALKRYCNERAIQMFGDVPIYIQYDSSDLWTHPELFKLDGAKRPYVVGGVPPDYFCKTGQRWGNPLYRWDVLRRTDYAWWMRRMGHNQALYDLVRVDHFLGLVAYWEVPAQEKTAINGKWVEAHGEDFLRVLFKKFPFFPLIAEDLGLVTPAVREVMGRFDIPGMKVLLFAFGDDLSANPFVSHNHVPGCVLYTGTHDNNTVRGWFESDATPEDRSRLFRYMGREIPAGEVAAEFIRMGMMSVAKIFIMPIQDLLGLGAEGRMNTPSAGSGNWKWKLLPEQITPEVTKHLRALTETYGRA